MDKFSFSQFWRSEIVTRSKFFISWLLSIITTSVTAYCFLRYPSNAVNVIMGIIIIPLLIQVLVVSLMTKTFRYIYQFEAAATFIIPFLMNFIGSMMGFWIASELFVGGFGAWIAMLSALTLLTLPLFANFFASGTSRILDLKPRVFYLLNLVQISLGALIMMLIFNHFFKH